MCSCKFLCVQLLFNESLSRMKGAYFADTTAAENIDVMRAVLGLSAVSWTVCVPVIYSAPLLKAM